MPRFALDERSATALVALLRRLGAVPDPGIDTDTIRFATIIAGSPQAERQKAMVDVIKAFVAEHNREIEREVRRSDFSPYFKGEFKPFLRKWSFEIWSLPGAPDDWREEMERRYKMAPPFAFVGGLAEGAWEPIASFCEVKRVPCIFPNTEFPSRSSAHRYTLYLSRGTLGEASALGSWLGEQIKAGNVFQIYRRSQGTSAALAEEFARALIASGGMAPTTVAVDDSPSMSIAEWKKLFDVGKASAVVLLTQKADVQTKNVLEASEGIAYSLGGLMLDDGMSGDELPNKPLLLALSKTLDETLPQKLRVRAWLHSRRIREHPETLQLNTQFTMSLVDHALMHMSGRYSRDYLIEEIQHEVENEPNPGVFPHLSLGPDQQYCSRGSYIVKVGRDGTLRAISTWFVPR